MTANKYRTFKEFTAHEVEGTDYRINYIDRGSKILVIAPHGGKIESYTTDIANLIAGKDFSFYSFMGIKTRNNKILHIPSHRFDEEKALKAVEKAETVIAIHGHENKKNGFVMIGGLDKELLARLKQDLKKIGFDIRLPAHALGGIAPDNICNRGRSGKGVQLEISKKLRLHLESNVALRKSFVQTIRYVLLKDIF